MNSEGLEELVWAEGGTVGNREKRPVLVMGWIPRIVLAVARSLHRYGIPVDVVDFVHAPRIRSRAIRNFTRVPYAGDDPRGFVNELRGFIGRHGHDMLIPTDDASLCALTEHYHELSDLLHIACPPPPITRLVLNKPATLEIAQKCGMLVPSTVMVSNSAQLTTFAETVSFPWILKPSEKRKRRDEFKSCLIRTKDDISKTFPVAWEFDPPMMLQEFCPGFGVGVEMLMHEGQCVAVFQHRRLQELPYGGGVAVTAIAESPDPELVRLSLDLLRAVRWSGVAMVEFKINPADGRAVFMEVNGRYWGTISFPIRLGLDFPLYHWKVVHGENPETSNTYTAGVKWRWTAGYIRRIHGLASAAGRSKDARKILFGSLLSSPLAFLPFVRDAIFAMDDPIPALFELGATFKYHFFHDLQMLFNRSAANKPID